MGLRSGRSEDFFIVLFFGAVDEPLYRTVSEFMSHIVYIHAMFKLLQ